jgi:hypothetical protein
MSNIHIDTSAPGEHIIEFSSTDQDGNIGTAGRIVRVIDPSAPVVEEPEPEPVIEITTVEEEPTATTTTEVIAEEEPVATTTPEVMAEVTPEPEPQPEASAPVEEIVE